MRNICSKLLVTGLLVNNSIAGLMNIYKSRPVNVEATDGVADVEE